jgi:rhodanese-related sulfurtransferase
MQQNDFISFFIQNWFLFFTAITSGVLLLLPVIKKGAAAAQISVTDAVLLMNREKAVLIDVSDKAEFAQQHAKGAKNAPLEQLAQSTVLPKNKTVPIVVLGSTMAAARRAVKQLQTMGYNKVHLLSGGFEAWRDAQLPIEKQSI